MAHIDLPENVPGIIGPLMQYPETARHLNGLAEALLRGSSSLTPAEREVIATYVSSQNQCIFCMSSHGAAARYLLGSEAGVVDLVKADYASAPIGDKLKALLAIAGQVQQGGRRVTEAHVAEARKAGADDQAIHDTVLIAAAFCMYNRYVDGLATLIPDDPAEYDIIGARIAKNGYSRTVSEG
ncbi:carboxymuconolactone decarboxylase [Capsulimonas corticalis]|uniref:Carboxymuconolactone decarboxylase n=1 Tax=Capsulimonas corticalis TaxID=2219043 RepID=A0A402D6P7_9BACT|nr:peroxidase-related enzyme [Capsulimonas corticalis]BDI29337.1 carboxymuconolactone decarboxylase [Capsulimonas corticalis]